MSRISRSRPEVQCCPVFDCRTVPVRVSAVTLVTVARSEMISRLATLTATARKVGESDGAAVSRGCAPAEHAVSVAAIKSMGLQPVAVFMT